MSSDRSLVHSFVVCVEYASTAIENGFAKANTISASLLSFAPRVQGFIAESFRVMESRPLKLVVPRTVNTVSGLLGVRWSGHNPP
jgi:hypothetical protein